MARRIQFSVLSIMLLTVCVALSIVLIATFSEAAKNAQRLALEQANTQSLTKQMQSMTEQAQKEFRGFHPPPILAIDPRFEPSTPILIGIFNSKTTTQRRTQEWQIPNYSKRLRFDLQLLRTLGQKDYYRLRWATDNAIDQANDAGMATVVFEYDGSTAKLVDTEEARIVLAPSRTAAVNSLADMRPAEEAEAVRQRWLQYAHVQFHTIPADHAPENLDHFK